MIKHFKKVSISILTMVLVLTSINIDVFANVEKPVLKPGDVTQRKTATWSDYEKGIAEISFDVAGKSAEEPVDVAVIYDNSGSMQISDQPGDYLTSRWHYASEAAKTFSNALLKNKDNKVALIPFSDTLIDGSSIHNNPSDYFETHEFIYDEDGNPDLSKMIGFAILYDALQRNQMTLDELYEFAEVDYNITKSEIDGLIEKNNTENAIVPFTKDSADINAAIDSLYPSNAGQTNYEIALSKAQELFSTKKQSNSNQVIVMISDGKPNVGGNGVAIANALKANGVTIYTCGTGIKDKDADALKKIASVENNAPLYTSSEPSDLEDTLNTIRKEIGVAAKNGVIKDEINIDYFEYFTDATHYPTVNGIKITDGELVVAENKGSITWNIGNIKEETKTLKFYVKIKDSLLNEELISKDESILNQKGEYATNKKANLTYEEINSGNLITIGHEMESPKISISTATMKQTYYLSDANGSFILSDGEKVKLWGETSANKALNIDYKIAPKASIEVDGVKYFILKEDNKEIAKKFTSNDIHAEFSFRYVEQLHVTFDTNRVGAFDDDSVTKKLPVDHTSMTLPNLPTVVNVPANTHFVGWNTKADGTGESFDSTKDIKEDITVYAQWIEDEKHIVTFKDSDGNTLKTQTVYEGESATAPEVPSKTGYTFNGWDTDFTNIKSDLTVTAEVTANQYYVSFDKNGATSGEMDQQEFTYDVAQNLSRNTLTRENHTFAGWLYNGKVYTNEEEVKNLTANANEQITFVAQWIENEKYVVTFMDSDGTTLKTEEVYKGEDATAPSNPSRTGYTFRGWDTSFTNITSNLTVTALWTQDEIIVVPPVQPTIPTTPPVTPPLTPTVTPPAATVAQPVINTPVQPIVPVTPTPEQNVNQPTETPEIETVKEEETPLAKGGSASWALINLLCSLGTILFALFIIISKHKKEEDEDDETVLYKRRRWTKFAGVITAVVSVIAFMITEDISLPMKYVDKWTIVMAIILVIQIAILVLAKRWKNTDKEETAINRV